MQYTLVKNRPFYDQGILKIVHFDSIRLHLGQKYGISLPKCARLAGRSTVKSRELLPLANMSASCSQHAVESHRRWRVRLPTTHSNGPGSSTLRLSSRWNVPEMSSRQSITRSNRPSRASRALSVMYKDLSTPAGTSLKHCFALLTSRRN